MDVLTRLEDLDLVWDSDKAQSNVSKHGVTFDQGAEVFLDPFVIFEDASVPGEERAAAIGYDLTNLTLVVVHLLQADGRFRIISARTASLRRGDGMKSLRERLKTRMQPNRPMTTISIRMPEDLIEEMKEIAPLLGFSGYQPLIRSYIGQGLRRDEMRLGQPEVAAVDRILREHGVADEVISEVLAATLKKSA